MMAQLADFDDLRHAGPCLRRGDVIMTIEPPLLVEKAAHLA